jgi:hypothetical protein
LGKLIPPVTRAPAGRRRRREAALKKLTEEEIDALGLAAEGLDAADRSKRRA